MRRRSRLLEFRLSLPCTPLYQSVPMDRPATIKPPSLIVIAIHDRCQTTYNRSNCASTRAVSCSISLKLPMLLAEMGGNSQHMSGCMAMSYLHTLCSCSLTILNFYKLDCTTQYGRSNCEFFIKSPADFHRYLLPTWSSQPVPIIKRVVLYIRILPTPYACWPL